MRSLVVDTSVILAVALGEPEKSKLIKMTKGTALLTPASMKWEIGNALSVMFKKKRITLGEAKKTWDICMDIPLQYVDVDPVRSLEIAFEGDLYAYDAYMIVCCLERRAPLLTLDQILLKKAGLFDVLTEAM